jgi:hypothetical protein
VGNTKNVGATIGVRTPMGAGVSVGGTTTGVGLGSGATSGLEVAVAKAVGVLTNLGVTVGGPCSGVGDGKRVGVGKGVTVRVGVFVGIGVPGVGVAVGLGVRVGTGVRLGPRVGRTGVPPGSTVLGSPVSMTMGPSAVGVGKRLRLLSSGNGLQAASSTIVHSAASTTEAVNIQTLLIARKEGRLRPGISKTITHAPKAVHRKVDKSVDIRRKKTAPSNVSKVKRQCGRAPCVSTPS